MTIYVRPAPRPSRHTPRSRRTLTSMRVIIISKGDTAGVITTRGRALWACTGRADLAVRAAREWCEERGHVVVDGQAFAPAINDARVVAAQRAA